MNAQLGDQPVATRALREFYLGAVKNGLSDRAHLAVLVLLLAGLAASLSVAVLGQSPQERLTEAICQRVRSNRQISIEIFMAVDATPTEIVEVRRFVDASARIASAKYLDKDAAYEEFKRIFRGEPDLVRNIDAAQLPSSFRVVPEDLEDTVRIKRQAIALPGVDDVAAPSRTVIDLCY